MASFFYNHWYYVRQQKERKKKYKIVLDETTDRFRRVEIIPKPKSEYLQRMRRLFPDFDQWDFEQQISMMGEDDEEQGTDEVNG
jgi:hypothetical protein